MFLTFFSALLFFPLTSEPLPGAVPTSSRRSTEERKTEGATTSSGVGSSGGVSGDGSNKVAPAPRT